MLIVVVDSEVTQNFNWKNVSIIDAPRLALVSTLTDDTETDINTHIEQLYVLYIDNHAHFIISDNLKVVQALSDLNVLAFYLPHKIQQ